MSERSFRAVVAAVTVLIVVGIISVTVLAIDKRHVEKAQQSYSACELTQGQTEWIDCE